MTYASIYCSLISKRLKNPLTQDEYCELHHIIPKSEGGTNERDNLIRLSAREHYIAHLLLAKIYKDKKMYAAIIFMRSGLYKWRQFNINSHLYEKVRKHCSVLMSGQNNHNYHKVFSKETRRKISESRKRFSGDKHPLFGKHHSDETKIKISMALKGRKGHKITEEIKQKMRSSTIGLKWYNDGVNEVRVRECPSGFIQGRLYHK